MRKKEKRKIIKLLIIAIIISAVIILGYLDPKIQNQINNLIKVEETQAKSQKSFDIENIPQYDKTPYVTINNNIPNFSEKDYTTESFEKYSQLDNLGRCGTAYANISKEIMPKQGETRESISNIKPTGWQSTKYENLIDGDYLYNRCHLIGWQLAGENANKLNLITGTRYMNIEGMLPFENLIDDYFEKKENEKNHVLYRVTPIFEGNNLIASGVQMEAYSIEDNGKGVRFNVYVYNVQPGIEINYSTGESKKLK